MVLSRPPRPSLTQAVTGGEHSARARNEAGLFIKLADAEEYPKAYSEGYKKIIKIFHIQEKFSVRLLTGVT